MDSLSNLLVQIKVGNSLKYRYVYVKKSNFIKRVLNCLVDNGYLRGYCELDYLFIVYLKYDGNKEIFVLLERVSKISNRIWIQAKDIDFANKKKIKYMLSTSKGIIINKGDFSLYYDNNIGGEILLKIK